jgi:hypothetical protein
METKMRTFSALKALFVCHVWQTLHFLGSIEMLLGRSINRFHIGLFLGLLKKSRGMIEQRRWTESDGKSEKYLECDLLSVVP